MIPTTVTAQDNTNGLVNYWPIHNGDINDHVGSGSYSGATSTSFQLNRFSVQNDAIYLQNGYFTIQVRSYVTGNFALMMWAKIISLPSASVSIFDCGQNSYPYDDILLAIDQTGLISTSIYSGTTLIGSANAANSPSLDTWFHLALTWDGSITRIYINGALSSNASSIGSGNPNTVNRNRCGFGLNYLSNSASLNGYLDEIRIYSR